MRRANGRCVACGETAKEAHHIVPLEGANRHDNCLNHQDNLKALCWKCHKKARERKRVQPAGAPLFDLEPYTVRVI